MKIRKTLRKWADKALGPSPQALEPITYRTAPADGYSARIFNYEVIEAAYEARNAVLESYGKIEDYKFKVNPITYSRLLMLTHKWGSPSPFQRVTDTLFGIPIAVDQEVGVDYVWIIRNPKLFDAKSGVKEVLRLDYS
jgi:hypothetical protein